MNEILDEINYLEDDICEGPEVVRYFKFEKTATCPNCHSIKDISTCLPTGEYIHGLEIVITSDEIDCIKQELDQIERRQMRNVINKIKKPRTENGFLRLEQGDMTSRYDRCGDELVHIQNVICDESEDSSEKKLMNLIAVLSSVTKRLIASSIVLSKTDILCSYSLSVVNKIPVKFKVNCPTSLAAIFKDS